MSRFSSLVFALPLLCTSLELISFTVAVSFIDAGNFKKSFASFWGWYMQI